MSNPVDPIQVSANDCAERCACSRVSSALPVATLSRRRACVRAGRSDSCSHGSLRAIDPDGERRLRQFAASCCKAVELAIAQAGEWNQ